MTKQKNKLLIFTKAPILGEVKTRLQPVYSVEQSIVIHKALVAKTLELTKDLAGIDVELCCAPNRTSLFFLECENNFPITLKNQEGEDLGERMGFALSVALKTYEKVLVIGTDCPDIDEGYIREALKVLDNADTVIGPAEDGGYVLLGLKQFSPLLFENIAWGEETVFEKTLAAFEQLKWRWQVLDLKHDVDRPNDLQRYEFLLNELK